MTLKEKILSISKRHKLSHIGSCLSVLPILEEIYSKKKPEDKVVLDNAHAHLAHLLFTPGDVEERLEQAGIHCDRSVGCDANGGSLGHGIGISIGMALAGNKVHCVVSDGSMMEGANWESLRLIRDLWWRKKAPITIYVNDNGYSAVAETWPEQLKKRMRSFIPIKFYETKNGQGFTGVKGHYKTL